ncbi:shikimate kinase, partial [Schnuerera sp.]|uniref:shikimate kinase n=1 Tax=Schnuerera sp. TaxID=2794844 RepID=UPI002BF400D7
ETIDYIFDRYGEQYFRDLEVKVIKEFSSKKGIVISTGGGVILNFKNIERLKRNGMIFLLDANIDTIVSNIQSSNASLENRPLLKDSDYLDCRIKDIYKERKKLYLSSANYIIKVDKKTCENIGNEIIYIYKQVNSCS